MASKFLDGPGAVVSAKKLKCAKAVDLAKFLLGLRNPYARFVEARRFETSAETIILEVDVELGQLQKYSIEPTERIGVVFDVTDESIPDVLALREDFPEVPHLNIRGDELPRSLCVYEEKYSDIKRTWTAARFVERIRTWLALTAKGKLHAEDQPLEQLLPASDYTLVVPPGIFAANAPSLQKLFVRFADHNHKSGVLIAETNTAKSPANSGFVAIPLQCSPQTHGVIHRAPKTLADLHAFVASAGLDLLTELRNRLRFLNETEKHLLAARLIIIIAFPKRRTDAISAETNELRVFLMAKTITELGVSIGLWNVVDGKVGILIFPDTSKTGVDVSVELANVTLALSPAAAAQLNGHTLEQQNITAIGAGALGSQTMLNLVRSGYGQWTVVDNDRLLPHNLARHVLDGEFVGRNKALSLQHVGNTLFTDPIIAKVIPSDVLKLTADEIAAAFAKASAILDFSASLPVARHLTHHVKSPARRLSMFLNPTGTDLVILAEDARRSMSLDLIEMQYYRALITNAELAGHLQNPPGRLRYAYSCRDITSNIPQDYVAIHSGIAARATRQVLAQNEAVIKVWRIDTATLKVTAIGVTPSPGIIEKRGTWTCVFDEAFLQKLHFLRNSKLPKETGGVLLGAFDVSRKIVYLVDTIPSPPDSEEWPKIYIRGNQGLAASVEQVSASTMKMIEYVGEWHSHPDNCACRPSMDDKKVFGWLTDLMDLDGLPACMIIVGEKQQTAMFLGQMLKQ